MYFFNSFSSNSIIQIYNESTYNVYVNGIEKMAIVTSETAKLMRNSLRSPEDLKNIYEYKQV